MNILNDENEESENSEKQNEKDLILTKFLQTRQLMLSGEINMELAEKLIKNLLVLEAMSPTEPIYLYINSPGGDVDAGFAIFDIIRFVQPEIIAIGTGLIASAATLVLLASKPENRYALPNSRYLIHQPLSQMQGVATDIEIHAQEIEKTKEKLDKLIAEETKNDIKKVVRDTDRDYWMSAEEAMDYGLVSKIMSERNDFGKKVSKPRTANKR